MAKLREDPITAQDLAEFVTSNSDFAFEMKVVAQLRALGFDCSHSGTYIDPVTDKVRQFDVRAIMDRGDFTLALAVECKNIHPNNPLLLSAVPRVADEAFHDLLVYYPPQGRTHIEAGNQSKYRLGQMVGKKTDQVGWSAGTLVSNDEATFDKLNQAVNSCRDLVFKFALSPSPPFLRAVVPLLVVPAGLLWQVDYSADGKIETLPREVKHAALFLDHNWSVEISHGFIVSYRLSHIEFATINALPEIVENYFGLEGFFPCSSSKDFFPD